MLRGLMRHPAKTMVEMARLLSASRKIAIATHSGLGPTFQRAIRLRFEKQFSPEEIYDLGLCEPRQYALLAPNWISRKRLTKLQEKLNPEFLAPLFKNKVLFYALCEATGLPIPRCRACFFKDATGWTAERTKIDSDAAWIDFFNTAAPQKFIIKPSLGDHGKGIMAFFRDGQDRFHAVGGSVFSAADVLNVMKQNTFGQCLIIQEYLQNHSAIVTLTGVDGRQTIRITTFIDRVGKCHFILSFAKLIVGDNVVDNFCDGTTGNILARIDAATGALYTARMAIQQMRPPRPVKCHPTTGKQIESFLIPYWKEACDLAQRAAMQFLPARTVGWDIIICPDGPRIVEGNIWWDSLGSMDSIESFFEANI